jgi:hypothetical protein
MSREFGAKYGESQEEEEGADKIFEHGFVVVGSYRIIIVSKSSAVQPE